MTAPATPRPGTLAARATATQQVIDKFRDLPFDWAHVNCWRLTRAQAVAMGHSFPPVPQFRSALGAKKALVADGCASAAEYLDRHFTRLPSPAFAWIGDLVLFPGDADGNATGLDAVSIADGAGNVFGWHGAAPGAEWVIGPMDQSIGAWRL